MLLSFNRPINIVANYPNGYFLASHQLLTAVVHFACFQKRIFRRGPGAHFLLRLSDLHRQTKARQLKADLLDNIQWLSRKKNPKTNPVYLLSISLVMSSSYQHFSPPMHDSKLSDLATLAFLILRNKCI